MHLRQVSEGVRAGGIPSELAAWLVRQAAPSSQSSDSSRPSSQEGVITCRVTLTFEMNRRRSTLTAVSKPRRGPRRRRQATSMPARADRVQRRSQRPRATGTPAEDPGRELRGDFFHPLVEDSESLPATARHTDENEAGEGSSACLRWRQAFELVLARRGEPVEEAKRAEWRMEGEAMATKALSIGGPAVIEEWRGIVKEWRSIGRLRVRCNVDEVGEEELEEMQRRKGWLGRGDLEPAALRAWGQFAVRWQQSAIDETVGRVLHIVERWRKAEMYDCYARAHGGMSSRGGVKRSSRALELAVWSIYGKDATAKQKEKVQRELRYGKRWSDLRRSMGEGIFALMSNTLLPMTYVEQTLNNTTFEAWVEMLMECNGHAKGMGGDVWPLLQRMLSGKTLPARPLRLERVEGGGLEHDQVDWFKEDVGDDVDVVDSQAECSSYYGSSQGFETLGSM